MYYLLPGITVCTPALQQSITGQWSTTTNLWSLTDGFSKKSSFIIIFRSNCMQILVKTGVIGNFAIFTGKCLCWSLILIKLQGPATLFQTRTKRDFNTDDSCENCTIFTNSFFMEHRQ